MRTASRLILPALAIVLVSGLTACGSAADALRDSETATEARAAEAAAPTSTVAETAPAVDMAAEATARTGDNAAAWATIDRGAQTFAGRLDQATQSIASCETEAAAGVDFNACLDISFTDIAGAGDELAMIVTEAASGAEGTCRDALIALGEATRQMAGDYRNAIGMTDLTSLETAYQVMADDAGRYAEAAMAAGGACATG